MGRRLMTFWVLETIWEGEMMSNKVGYYHVVYTFKAANGALAFGCSTSSVEKPKLNKDFIEKITNSLKIDLSVDDLVIINIIKLDE
jgi:hypothetical protein